MHVACSKIEAQLYYLSSLVPDTCIGHWFLGSRPPTLPLSQQFTLSEKQVLMLLMLGEEKVGSFQEITRKITLNDFPKILHKILNNPPDICLGVVQVIFFAFDKLY